MPVAPVTNEADTGFDRFFAREIAPWLEGEEQQRRSLVARYWRLLVPLGVAGIVAFLGVGVFWPVLFDYWPFFLFGAIFIGISIGYPLYVWSDRFNAELLRRVFLFFNYSYEPKASQNILDSFSALGILPDYNRETLTDHVGGEVDDVSFEITEAELIRRSRNRKNESTDTTVFLGLLARFDFPKPFKSRTLVLADKGSIFNLLGGLFGQDARVRLEDPRFEAAFDVFSPDQIEARYLLTPAFMERLLALKARMDCPICAAFESGQLWLAIDGRRDYFPRYSIWRDVRESDQARRLVDDILLIRDMARMLRLDNATLV